MPRRDEGYQEFLNELDASLDDVLRKMDRWEDELRTTIRKGDSEQVIEVARKGGTFSQSSREARDNLLEARSAEGEDLSDGALEKAKAAVKAKCDLIDERLQRALDEVMAQQEAVDDKMRRTLEDMEGLGELDFYPDGESTEEMKELKKKYDRERKRQA